MADDPERDLIPVREESGFNSGMKTPASAFPLDERGPSSLQNYAISKMDRYDLEDRFLQIQDQNTGLKKLCHQQEDKYKRLAAKLLRLASDRKQRLPSAEQRRDLAAEDVIDEQAVRIRELEQANVNLQDRLTVLKQQLASHTRVHNAAHCGPRPVSRSPSRQRASGLLSSSDLYRGTSSGGSGHLPRDDGADAQAAREEEKRLLSEITVLRQQMQGMEQEIRLLRDQAAQRVAEQEEEMVHDAMEEKRQKVAENVEMIRTKRLSKQQSAQILALQAHNQAMERDLAQLKQTMEATQKENDELHEQVLQERKRVSDYQQEVASLTSYKETVKELREEILDSQREKATLKQHNQQLLALSATALNTEQAREKQMLDRLAQLEALLATERAEKNLALRNLEEQQLLVTSLQKQLLEQEKQCQCLEDTVKTLTLKSASMTAPVVVDGRLEPTASSTSKGLSSGRESATHFPQDVATPSAGLLPEGYVLYDAVDSTHGSYSDQTRVRQAAKPSSPKVRKEDQPSCVLAAPSSVSSTSAASSGTSTSSSKSSSVSLKKEHKKKASRDEVKSSRLRPSSSHHGTKSKESQIEGSSTHRPVVLNGKASKSKIVTNGAEENARSASRKSLPGKRELPPRQDRVPSELDSETSEAVSEPIRAEAKATKTRDASRLKAGKRSSSVQHGSRLKQEAEAAEWDSRTASRVSEDDKAQEALRLETARELQKCRELLRVQYNLNSLYKREVESLNRTLDMKEMELEKQLEEMKSELKTHSSTINRLESKLGAEFWETNSKVPSASPAALQEVIPERTSKASGGIVPSQALSLDAGDGLFQIHIQNVRLEGETDGLELKQFQLRWTFYDHDPSHTPWFSGAESRLEHTTLYKVNVSGDFLQYLSNEMCVMELVMMTADGTEEEATGEARLDFSEAISSRCDRRQLILPLMSLSDEPKEIGVLSCWYQIVCNREVLDGFIKCPCRKDDSSQIPAETEKEDSTQKSVVTFEVPADVSLVERPSESEKLPDEGEIKAVEGEGEEPRENGSLTMGVVAEKQPSAEDPSSTSVLAAESEQLVTEASEDSISIHRKSSVYEGNSAELVRIPEAPELDLEGGSRSEKAAEAGGEKDAPVTAKAEGTTDDRVAEEANEEKRNSGYLSLISVNTARAFPSTVMSPFDPDAKVPPQTAEPTTENNKHESINDGEEDDVFKEANWQKYSMLSIQELLRDDKKEIPVKGDNMSKYDLNNVSKYDLNNVSSSSESTSERDLPHPHDSGTGLSKQVCYLGESPKNFKRSNKPSIIEESSGSCILEEDEREKPDSIASDEYDDDKDVEVEDRSKYAGQSVAPSSPPKATERRNTHLYQTLPDCIEIFIHSLTLAHNTAFMKTADISQLYIEFSFLGFNGEEMETLSVPLNNDLHMIFDYRKKFYVDYGMNYKQWTMLSHILTSINKKRTNLRFIVVSEPPEEQDHMKECEEIGYADVNLVELMVDGHDLVKENVPVKSVDGSERLGFLTITITGVKLMRKVAYNDR